MDTPPTTDQPRSMLIQWANAQDHWVRAIVAELLTTGEPLADPQLAHHFERMMREKQLLDGEITEVPQLGALTASVGQTHSLKLTALSDVRGVNALAPGQKIEFSRRLTVLFGENATGKTGYVRILKRVARVRTAEAILPNIDTAANRQPPHASIAFDLDGTSSNIDWNGEEGIFPLTQIDVFDSRGTSVHVDQDLTFTYTPRELALFQNVYQAIDNIKTRLDASRKARLNSSNSFVSRFARGTAIYSKIEALGAATDLGELLTLSQVNPDEELSLASLVERVEALRPEGTDGKLKLALAEQQFFSRIRGAVNTIATLNGDAYCIAAKALAEARRRETEFSENSFKDSRIPGAFSIPWRTFLAAADRYASEADLKDYPTIGSACLYCRQPLPEQSAALIRKYQQVLAGELARACQSHEEQLVALSKAVLSHAFGPVEAEVRSRTAIESDPDRRKHLDHCLAVLELAPHLQAQLKAQAADIDQTVLLPAIAARDWAAHSEATSQQLVVDLTAEVGKRRAAFDKESTILRNLEARLRLRELLPAIREFVENAKWADKANILLKRFVPLSKSITEASKQASDSLLNRDFEERFQVEREKLAAPLVRLEFPGAKGQPARRKAISSDFRLSETLSEGEQKVIALADFLAEVGLKGNSCPIIFDDPVNSLDYKRLEYVVRRIVEISDSRQVVVFTHNIWFAAELLSEFSDGANKGQCSYFDITADNRGRGLVSPANNPRTDSFNSLKTRINTLIADAAKQTGETQQAIIEKAYEILRGLTEVIVEADLLKGVTRRYQPNVMVTALPKIRGDRLGAAIIVLLPIFEKCCRVISSHSQPLETLNVRPSLAELQQDWREVQSARDAYIKEDKT
jgi:hypothetical protein